MARITTITLENFKGISDPVEIPLRPITLLFGKNSAGKSTILHAILYARHILHTGWMDVDEIELGGDSIDLGGFNNFVYKHEIGRKVKIRFEIDLGRDSLAFNDDLIHFDPAFDTFEKRFNSAEKIYVEFVIRREAGEDVSKECNIGIDNNLTVNVQWINNGQSQSNEPSVKYFLSEHDFFEEYPIGSIKFQSLDPLPSIGHTLKFYGIDDSEELFNYILNNCIMRPLEILSELITPIRYIGPIRKIPERNYAPHYTQNNERWASGLAAWDVLMNPNLKEEKEHLRQRVNSALNELKLDYEIVKVQHILTQTGVPENAKGIANLAKELPQMNEDRLRIHMNNNPNLDGGVEFYLKEKSRNIKVALYDIGVGISQITPVVVGALANDPNTGRRPSIFAVEQPELHVHPAVQCELGDLFIREYKNQMFLIETHSEHLILRILRRIKESYEGTLPETSELKISSNDLSILTLSKENNITKIASMEVSDEGEIISPWPGGFFDERYNELLGD